jgi:outer membrane receptor protein involved in Fe transport
MLPEYEGVPGRHGQLPSPDLRPENGVSVDAGSRVQVHPSLLIALRGFVTRVDDAIVENRVSSDPSQSRSVNAGRTRALGVELEIEGRLPGRLSWYANATFSDTEIDNPLDTDQDGASVPFAPGITANAGLSLELPRGARLFADLMHGGAYFDSTSLSGREEIPAHVVVSLAGSYPLARHRRFEADLKAEVNNLFDERFDMPWQFRDPGRRGSVSLQLVF